MNHITPSICKRWNSFLLTGFFLVILGSIALSSAFWTTMATVLFFGSLMIAAGLANALHSFWNPEWRGFIVQLLVGILSTVVGALILTNPDIGAASITLMIASFFVAAGLFKVAGSLTQNIENWGWMLGSGLVTLTLGLLILAQWPESSYWVLGLFIAVDLIVSGWSTIMYSLAIRNACKLQEQKTA